MISDSTCSGWSNGSSSCLISKCYVCSDANLKDHHWSIASVKTDDFPSMSNFDWSSVTNAEVDAVTIAMDWSFVPPWCLFKLSVGFVLTASKGYSLSDSC